MKVFLKNKTKVKRIAKSLLVVTILVLGLFLRLYKLEERTMFDADQEWMSNRSSQILKGDLALIGPITSIGSFSIGPGFIYLWTIFSFFLKGDPISGAFLSIFLGVLANLAVYFFARKYINEKVGLILLFLLNVTFNFIVWDINPWAPSLFFLAQTILLYGTYLATKNVWGLPLMAIGLVMGFQSHFGIFLSLVSVFLYSLFFKPVKPNLKILVITFLIIFFGFLPNIVFDLANNFVNLKRFLSIIKGDDYDYFVSFGKIINTLAGNVVPLVYPRNAKIFDSVIIKIIFALIIVNTLKLLRDKNRKGLSFLLLITTIVPSLFFYIQQGKFSEYYLMMTTPSLVLMLGLLLSSLKINKLVLVGILIFSTFINLYYWKSYSEKMNLGAKKAVVNYIKETAGDSGYGISLSTRVGYQYGFDYIFKYYGIKADIPPKKGETRIFSIVVPNGFDGMNSAKDFDGIGLIEQGI